MVWAYGELGTDVRPMLMPDDNPFVTHHRNEVFQGNTLKLNRRNIIWKTQNFRKMKKTKKRKANRNYVLFPLRFPPPSHSGIRKECEPKPEIHFHFPVPSIHILPRRPSSGLNPHPLTFSLSQHSRRKPTKLRRELNAKRYSSKEIV